MQSRTKRHLTPAALDALLRGSAGMGCRLEHELTDGWFNSAYRVLLDDGRPAVVKLAPPPAAPVLRYERGILGTETMVYRRLADLPEGSVPAPELLHADEEFIVLSVLEGTPWDKAGDHLPPGAGEALRRELGAVTARLHTLTPADGRFGYPAGDSALTAADWRTAFTAMVEALLDDADRWRSPLDVPPRDLRALVSDGGYALDEVTEPRLVHFDLWPGNIFVRAADDAGPARITGLIDHERAFWGDPAAELVSLDFGGGTGPDSELAAGYTGAGGSLDFTPALRHRLALYQLYLGLLLVVECAPRGYGGEHLAFCRRMLADAVTRLRALG
ncbi:phosphotransferase family protein [Streptomyces vietnamensis]|uniref:Phosphotransferase n=1 Tax=Streptomyces vietnamensis TaxID=362257 RepID=A0A0B5HMH8_9ACTN|nr:aminoglycoside phosphotransferase family protein [Streptomyces vietnamensis]AJF63290.1 phosphotransferase [Streptomyces vietnamensis]